MPHLLMPVSVTPNDTLIHHSMVSATIILLKLFSPKLPNSSLLLNWLNIQCYVLPICYALFYISYALRCYNFSNSENYLRVCRENFLLTNSHTYSFHLYVALDNV